MVFCRNEMLFYAQYSFSCLQVCTRSLDKEHLSETSKRKMALFIKWAHLYSFKNYFHLVRLLTIHFQKCIFYILFAFTFFLMVDLFKVDSNRLFSPQYWSINIRYCLPFLLFVAIFMHLLVFTTKFHFKLSHCVTIGQKYIPWPHSVNLSLSLPVFSEILVVVFFFSFPLQDCLWPVGGCFSGLHGVIS